jgi:hypothetical protein
MVSLNSHTTGRGPVDAMHSRPPRHASACVAACGLSLVLHLAMFLTLGIGGVGKNAELARSSEMLVELDRHSSLAGVTGEDNRRAPEWLEKIEPQLPRYLDMLAQTETVPFLPTFDESAYLSASELTVRPSAARYIQVPFPPAITGQGSWSAVLAVFINENGMVAKVRVFGGSLPTACAEAAIATFRSAHFHPGRIGERPVKSRMLVQVEFDGDDHDREAPSLASISGKSTAAVP